MGFYDTYSDIFVNPVSDIPELNEAGFRNRLLSTQEHNMDLIKLFASGVRHTLNKPQRVLHDDDEYYVGIDLYTGTYYVCYKQLLMVDIDYYKGDIETDEIEIINNFKALCQQQPDFLFRLYRSRNGIHGFLVSTRMNYRNNEIISLILNLGSDFYYTVYSYLRGWSVRLNRKTTDTSDQLYTYICDIGTGTLDPLLDKLTNLHINLVDVFKNTKPNTMHGS